MLEQRINLSPRPEWSHASPTGATPIKEREFQDIKAWIYRVAGINLSNQ